MRNTVPEDGEQQQRGCCHHEVGLIGLKAHFWNVETGHPQRFAPRFNDPGSDNVEKHDGYPARISCTCILIISDLRSGSQSQLRVRLKTARGVTLHRLSVMMGEHGGGQVAAVVMTVCEPGAGAGVGAVDERARFGKTVG